MKQSSECATVWFAILERARNLNDFERAAEAQRRLKQLGVKVEFEARNRDREAVTA